MWKKVCKQLVLPIMLAAILAMLFRPIYLQDDSCNYFLAWILIGFPFGIRRMHLWMFPSKFDLGGTVGIFALNIIIGGLIGGIALLLDILSGIYYLLKMIFSGIKGW